jgi:hypothetical protein
MTDELASDSIVRLVGVYDADGSVVGELSYFVRARFGRAHCALCDITHGLVRERADWRTARSALPVPFLTFHRDDQPDDVRAAGGSDPPMVIAETSRGDHVVLLDRDRLERCAGSPARLVDALDAAARARDLVWSARTADGAQRFG